MSQFSVLINDALDRMGVGGLSSRDLSERVRGEISKDSIARYRRGEHGTPSEPVLIAFAELTGLDVETLRQAAGVSDDGGGEWTPPAEAVRLTRRQRLALDELIRAMVATPNERDDAEWLLAHPDRDAVLQSQLADVRRIRNVSPRQREQLEETIRGERRSALIRDLSHELD